MDSVFEFISQHAPIAHWVIFICVLLAGMGVPISIDLLMILGAVLAAQVVPDNIWLLYGALFFGCCFSAWIAYWIGRLLGPKLSKTRYFARLLSETRMAKVRRFYDKYGLWTLVIGRFIPLGVRNCIFMSTGMSRMHFGKFILRDTFACLVWSSTCFSLLYLLGQNYYTLYHHFKTFNLLLLAVFGIAGIGLIWYKKSKKKNVSDDADSI
jgi:membrane-associated protein